MKCPNCVEGETKVLRTREGAPGERVRERGCKDCGYRFTTTEKRTALYMAKR